MNKTAIEWCASEREKGFLEGLIDGEGSISLLKETRQRFSAGCTYKPRLNISNKCRPLLEKASELIGGGAIIGPNKSGVFNLDVSAQLMRAVLPNLHLISKERQRILVLEALQVLSVKAGRSRPRDKESVEKLEEIHTHIRKSNGRYDRYE